MPENVALPKSSGAFGLRMHPAFGKILSASVSTTTAFARFGARRVSKRPASTIAGAAFAAMLMGVAINALYFQRTRQLATPPGQIASVSAPTSTSSAASTARLQTIAAPSAPVPVLETDAATTASIPERKRREDLNGAMSAREATSRGNSERSSRPTRDNKGRHAKTGAKEKKAKQIDKISRLLAVDNPHKHKAIRDAE